MSTEREVFMSSLPGHQKQSGHKVNQTHVTQRDSAVTGARRVAGPRDVILVVEDEAPSRGDFDCFPREGVTVGQRDRSEHGALTRRLAILDDKHSAITVLVASEGHAP